jgi:hypothetical protein
MVMTGLDMIRHWGKRDYVNEVSDSDSEFGNGLLPTILEEDDCHSDEDEIFDQEYGNPDEDTSSSNEDEDGDNHDGVLNEEDDSSLKKPQLHDEIGGDNLLLNASASATGKYRSVSIFGGVFDMPDPASDDDSISSSTDCFSDDDWSAEEAKAKDTKEASISKQKSTLKRGQQKGPENEVVAPQLDILSQKNDTVSSTLTKNIDKIEDMSPLMEANMKHESTSADIISTTPAAPQKEVGSSGDEQDTVAESFSTASDIPVEPDKLYHDPSEEKQILLHKFLNELCFFPFKQ